MEIFIFYLAIPIFAIVEAVFIGLSDTRVKYLERENRMLWRLLSDQAKLHEMSLDAYIAMLREAQQHTGGQQF